MRQLRVRDYLIRSVVLGAGMGAWQAFVHAQIMGNPEAGRPPHMMRDSMLLWPLALAAVIAGHRLASRMGGPEGDATRPGAFAAALILCLMLVPAVGIHGWIDDALSVAAVHSHAVDAATAHSHAGDGAGLGTLSHGVRDAAVGLVAAVPVAIIGTRMTRRGRRRSRMPVVVAVAILLAAFPATAEPSSVSLEPFSRPLPIPRVLTGSDNKITMKQADLQILPGRKTRMWTYDGTFPGPTIRRPSGKTTKVTFVNSLPAAAGPTTVHLHGAHSASSEDGQPHHNLISVGGSRTYTYRFWEDGRPERAATHWYHDHMMDRTGRNVWMGLAGVQILDDAFDAALPLPKGAFDVPLILTDRTFDANNQLVVPTQTKIAAGDRVLVNGAVQPYFEVAARKYRFRMVNASHLVSYRIGLSNGRDMVHIASESGLLPAPVRRSNLVIGPGERAEVVIDFAGLRGRDIVLVNSAGPAGPAIVRDTPAPVNGVVAPPDLLRFRVRRNATDTSRIPARLRPAPEFGPASITRHWTLDSIPAAGIVHGSGAIDPSAPPASNVFGSMLWTINGLPFDADRVDARPLLGATERWIFTNTSPAGHLVHIHDVDWKIVSRKGGVTVLSDVDPEVQLGETGLKETFLVSAGETVEVISKFTDHLGRYVFHCHVLPHEDAAMMAQFEVTNSAQLPIDSRI